MPSVRLPTQICAQLQALFKTTLNAMVIAIVTKIIYGYSVPGTLLKDNDLLRCIQIFENVFIGKDLVISERMYCVYVGYICSHIKLISGINTWILTSLCFDRCLSLGVRLKIYFGRTTLVEVDRSICAYLYIILSRKFASKSTTPPSRSQQ